ncbi:MAG: tripartite tricarboxylate transporter TctB family protein [Casimicrobiaceae bacterium]
MGEPVEQGSKSTDSQSVVSMRMAEAVVAAIIFVASGVFVYSSYRLGNGWSSDGPESGFFPFYVSLIICGAALVVLFGALYGAQSKQSTESFVERGQLKQVLSVLIPALLYVLAVQLIGIYVASAIYILLFMHFLGKYSWLKSAMLGITIIVIFFLMFEVWFQVPLYKGMWDATGFTGY